mmetsp:Transcript_133415/g.386193  ORF Transcript_133415/g.386193 Transcript_133415/m.386193 type:complete len:197 (-) Transcript_133415:143-733(-)
MPSAKPSSAASGQVRDRHMFADAHDFMAYTTKEIAELKAKIMREDEAARAEAERLRGEIAKERLYRRNDLNELRYEFEEFIHKKIDKVLETVEDMKKTERRDDRSQQVEIDTLSEDIDRLKRYLIGVQGAWAGVCANFSTALTDPEKLQESQLTAPMSCTGTGMQQPLSPTGSVQQSPMSRASTAKGQASPRSPRR